MSDAGDPERARSSEGPTAPVEATSVYGVTMALVGGVLLALGYYGYLAIRGAREIGQALPEPFYVLAIAVLFVVELFNSREYGLWAVGRAIAFAAVYGGLFVLAVEGGAYVWNDPAVALEGFAGVTVFAVAMITAALVYFGYLLVLESEWRSSA